MDLYDQRDSKGQLSFISMEGVPIYPESQVVRNTLNQLKKYPKYLFAVTLHQEMAIREILDSIFKPLYLQKAKHIMDRLSTVLQFTLNEIIFHMLVSKQGVINL